MLNVNSRAFTLIELLVVVSVIAFLTSIIVATLSTAKARAQQTRRIEDVRTVGNALALYAADHKGEYPVIEGAVNGTVCWECADTTYKIDPDKLSALAPYLSVRPSDPALPPVMDDYGYWYKSDGTNYKFINIVAESHRSYIPFSLLDDNFSKSGHPGIRVSSSGESENWTIDCDPQIAGSCPPAGEEKRCAVRLEGKGEGEVEYGIATPIGYKEYQGILNFPKAPTSFSIIPNGTLFVKLTPDGTITADGTTIGQRATHTFTETGVPPNCSPQNIIINFP